MSAPIHPKSIVILDFGGQYAHLIARRVRECGAFSEIRPPETSVEILKEASGIILSGGPQSVYEKGSPQADPKILELGIPVLGICYGHQWLAHVLGGTVQPGKTKEYGHATIDIIEPGTFFAGLPKKFSVWMSHGDTVTELPKGFITTAKSGDGHVSAMADEARKMFGVQFHIEVVHSQHGSEMLKRFTDLCDHAEWSVRGYAQRIGTEVLNQVGDRKVFMLVSGGVDSTVAFTVLNESLGPARVQGLMVDTGLMRKNEVRRMMDAFDLLGIENLEIVDASVEFFEKLKGVTDPEKKRHIIGDAFLSVQKRVSDEMHLKMEDGWMLGQGTIYPDTIETGGTKHSDTIKTHHNRVPAIQKMIDAGLVIEPLKDLYKDEVRLLGEEFRIPHELVWRHPFPGPGLGVRILCADGPDTSVAAIDDRLDVLHRVLPIRSVGVQGDGRTYRHAVALFDKDCCTITDEQMNLATSVPNRLPDYNRVLLCTSHTAPPASFSFTPGGITFERAELLREADYIVDDAMHRAELYEKIWQFPVVLLPFGEKEGNHSIVLRPVDSQEAMTASAIRLEPSVLREITKRILEVPGIDMVFMDLTNKPPATIEWE